MVSKTPLTETEIKLYVPDLGSVAARLSALGGKLAAPRVFEHNERYEDAEETLAAQGIVLRLRQDTRARLTYKEPHGDPGDDDIPSRYEAEVEVSDFGTMSAILGKLGYHPLMIYEKYRTTFHFEDTEVVLDELPYGNFVEIEGTAEAIRRVVDRLELQSAPRFRSNYVRLMDNVKRYLSLGFSDLTFKNFEGITVPVEAFEAAAKDSIP